MKEASVVSLLGPAGPTFPERSRNSGPCVLVSGFATLREPSCQVGHGIPAFAVNGSCFGFPFRLALVCTRVGLWSGDANARH